MAHAQLFYPRLETLSMRIYEDNFAYEIEQVLDPATLIPSGWKFNIYQVRPFNQLLGSGNAPTREAAEQEGRRAVQQAIRQQQGKSAA
jgi:hypothetical protein